MPAPDLPDFEVVDVFAPRPFSGNQLAVVLDAGELTDGGVSVLAWDPVTVGIASGAVRVPSRA